MKISGYADRGLPPDEVVPEELVEVTLKASSSELRRMAEFLVFCASEMDRIGEKYDHIHLSDQMKEFRRSPHFVVTRLSL